MNFNQFKYIYYISTFIFFAYVILMFQGAIVIDSLYNYIIIGIYLIIIFYYVYLKTKKGPKDDNREENKKV